MNSMKSTLTCPRCGHKQSEEIPENVCLQFYICNNCKEKISSLEGDCCVFCSHGDRKCLLKSEDDIKQ